MTHDHIFLEANQVVLLAAECRFGQDLGGFLETRRRDEAVRVHSSLGNSLKHRLGAGRHLALLHQVRADLFEFMAVDNCIG